jgi:hypothetical protein
MGQLGAFITNQPISSMFEKLLAEPILSHQIMN